MWKSRVKSWVPKNWRPNTGDQTQSETTQSKFTVPIVWSFRTMLCYGCSVCKVFLVRACARKELLSLLKCGVSESSALNRYHLHPFTNCKHVHFLWTKHVFSVLLLPSKTCPWLRFGFFSKAWGVWNPVPCQFRLRAWQADVAWGNFVNSRGHMKKNRQRSTIQY